MESAQKVIGKYGEENMGLYSDLEIEMKLCRRCMNNVQIQTMNVKNGVGDHRNIVTYVYEYNNPKIGLLFTNMML